MKNKKNSFRLSSKLFSAIIGASLVVGLALTSLQVWLDWRFTSHQIDQLGSETAYLLRYPAQEASIRLDKVMAHRLLEGAFARPFVSAASLSSENGVLAELRRDDANVQHRLLSDWAFGHQREFSMTIDSTMSGEQRTRQPYEVYGTLALTIDTGIHGSEFINRAFVCMLAGSLQSIGFALLLYLIIHGLITRPLEGLIRALGNIDPRKPGRHKLIAPRGHENDEIGTWVDTCNHLLEAVDEYNRQRRLAEAHVERLSNYDPLTELPNRSHLLRTLEACTNEGSNGAVALLYFGLDDFSSVNLLHSYRAGDRILIQLSQRLRDQLPAHAVLARVGGDQFCAVINDANDARARTLAEALINAARQPFEIHDQPLEMAATVGIACFPRDGLTPELLLKNAEQVMLLGKSTGGNNVSMYSEMADQRQRATKQLEKDLMGAVVNQQLQLMFQPQVNLVTGRIDGFEALLRWNHPTRGRVSPDEFIVLAEANRAVIPIGRWVLEQAARLLKCWMEAGHDDISLSVNLSTVQLHHDGMLADLTRILDQHALPARTLTLEITETAVMEDLDRSIDLLQAIHDLGVRLAIDDFGTGYSSLSYLRRMPIDELKLDRSFFADANLQGNGAKIIESMVHLSHNLNLEVVAEGTETLDQVDLLRHCRCDRAQGYYFSEPVGEDDVLPLLSGQMRLRNALHPGLTPADPSPAVG